jgi:hypothetical protein
MPKQIERQIHETTDRTREISGPATARSARSEGAATNLLPSGCEVVALGYRPRLGKRGRRRRRRHERVLPRGRGSRQAEGSVDSERASSRGTIGLGAGCVVQAHQLTVNGHGPRVRITLDGLVFSGRKKSTYLP